MKLFGYSLVILVGLFIGHIVSAQNPAAKTVAASKKDDRPSPPRVAKAQVGGNLDVTINYSAPAVKGRKIFGELVPFGQVWRTGANEATTIEFSRDTKVAGNGVRAGRYALFTIPGENTWTIILNTDADQWGAYKYNEQKDVVRFEVKSEKTAQLQERLTFNISESGEISLSWENTRVSFSVY